MARMFRGSLVRILLALALAAPLTLPVASAHAAGYDPRTAVISTAIAQLGKPYQWAADGPDSYDCSGLVMYCYGKAGISLPHQSGLIWSKCDTVTVDKLEPGDLVFRTNLADPAQQPSSPSHIRHVGIYVGGGQVIHAPTTGQNVSYTAVTNFRFAGRLKTGNWPLGDRTYDQPPLLRGDFTGDGRDDLAFFQGLGGTSIRASVAPSSGNAQGPLKAWYSNTRWDWNRSKVVTGDFNRDGKTDLAVLYDYGGDTVKLWAYISNGTAFQPAVWWASTTGGWSWQRTKLISGDFDGDGDTDVGMFVDKGGNTSQLYVAKSGGTSFSAPASWWYSGTGHWDAKCSKLVAGDLTGDRRFDVAVLYDYGRGGSKLWVLKSTGSSSFALQFTPWYASAGWGWEKAKMAATDLNGDRKSDLVMLYDYGASNTKLWSFLSNGTTFSTIKPYWTSPPNGWDWERAKLGVGDLDREGRSDVFMLYDNRKATSTAWAFDSSADGTSGSAYLGFSSGAGGMEWNRVK